MADRSYQPCCGVYNKCCLCAAVSLSIVLVLVFLMTLCSPKPGENIVVAPQDTLDRETLRTFLVVVKGKNAAER